MFRLKIQRLKKIFFFLNVVLVPLLLFLYCLGPIHADELPYLFYKPAAINNFKEIKPSDFKVIRHMCSLWTNFAKTGYELIIYIFFKRFTYKNFTLL